ncbi:MAG: hypothetical protein AAB539_04220 [Patescibacteria group bacterium]
MKRVLVGVCVLVVGAIILAGMSVVGKARGGAIALSGPEEWILAGLFGTLSGILPEFEAEYRSHLAIRFFEESKWKEADEELKRIPSRFEDWVEYQSGWRHLRERQFEEAALAFERALEHNPGDIATKINLELLRQEEREFSGSEGKKSEGEKKEGRELEREKKEGSEDEKKERTRGRKEREKSRFFGGDRRELFLDPWSSQDSTGERARRDSGRY